MPTGEDITTLHGLMGSSVARLREGAVDKLALWVDDPALPEASRTSVALALLAAVEDVRPAIADAAMIALRLFKGSARDALFERAIRSEDARVGLGAARIWPTLLAPSGGEEARGARLAAAFEAATPGVAVAAIAFHCGEIPRPLLDNWRTAEASDPGASSRRAAVTACDLMAVPEQPPDALAAALEAPAVDANVVLGLARWIATWPSPPRDGAGMARLTAALARHAARESWSVAIPIGEARAVLGALDGVATLAVFTRGSEPDARFAALAALTRLGERSRLGHPSVLAALERAAVDADPAVRELVAEVAGLVDDGRVASLLTSLIHDDMVDVRFQAAYAMGRSGDRRLVSPLCEYGIVDTDEPVRDASYAALHHIVHGHALPPPSSVSDWLSHPPEAQIPPFWGRDHLKWRAYWQSL